MLNILKDAIDLGIVTGNSAAMVSFYRDLLGLKEEGIIPMPGGGTMHRLKAGDSIIKIVETDPAPPEEAIPGGIRAATGYRYWTITVGNLEQCLEVLRGKDVPIPVGPKTVRPGVTIAMVVDPDGNWLELIQYD
ncbi:MAG: VOC family protein [Pseudohongiellaceae bacterium]